MLKSNKNNIRSKQDRVRVNCHVHLCVIYAILSLTLQLRWKIYMDSYNYLETNYQYSNMIGQPVLPRWNCPGKKYLSPESSPCRNQSGSMGKWKALPHTRSLVFRSWVYTLLQWAHALFMSDIYSLYGGNGLIGHVLPGCCQINISPIESFIFFLSTHLTYSTVISLLYWCLFGEISFLCNISALCCGIPCIREVLKATL